MTGDPTLDTTVSALILHLEAHPQARAEDAYKLLHQSVFGPGHMVSSRAAAAGYLDQELSALASTGGTEPMCEDLGGEPGMVRLHLRPLRDRGADIESLIDAFVASANTVEGSPARMTRLMEVAGGSLRFAGHGEVATALGELGRRLEAEGYPAVHHSGAFREAYRPAYRVVMKELAVEHRWCQESAPTPPGDTAGAAG